MRCLIADDEAPAREHLRALLQLYPDVEVSAEASSGAQALELARSQVFELAFLDLEMPPLHGLDVAQALLELPWAPAVVFLTGHAQHAVEAYEIGALDYLLKPVRRDRLSRTLERVKRRSPDRMLLTHPVTQAQEVVTPADVSFFTVESEVVLARARGAFYRVNQPLSRLEERLAGEQFLRVHKAYLVNLRRVSRVVRFTRRSSTLVMDCGSEIPLSRHYTEAFRARVPEL